MPRTTTKKRPSAPKKKAPSSKKPYPKVAKEQKRRRKPGRLAAMEIRRLEKTTEALLQKAPFQRMVRELSGRGHPGDKVSFKPTALTLLQEAAEQYMSRFFQQAVYASMHAGRKTLMLKDMIFVNRLRGSG